MLTKAIKCVFNEVTVKAHTHIQISYQHFLNEKNPFAGFFFLIEKELWYVWSHALTKAYSLQPKKKVEMEIKDQHNEDFMCCFFLMEYLSFSRDCLVCLVFLRQTEISLAQILPFFTALVF